DVGPVRLADALGRLVPPLLRYPALEEVGRLDGVVVDADEDEVFGAHGSPRVTGVQIPHDATAILGLRGQRTAGGTRPARPIGAGWRPRCGAGPVRRRARRPGRPSTTGTGAPRPSRTGWRRRVPAPG